MEPYLDRAGVHCRTVKDAAMVLDALKNPERGYYDPRDIYSALPRALLPEAPYASVVVDRETMGSTPLAGMRIGVVREYMVKHTDNDAAMSDLVNEEIIRVLRDELGAEIVESFDPEYPDDPLIPNMEYNFQRAIAEILPVHMPEFASGKRRRRRIQVRRAPLRRVDARLSCESRRRHSAAVGRFEPPQYQQLAGDGELQFPPCRST